MIDQLRIKCPSCGIVLDVRNSKHESVKKITCPNCKKQLAIDFKDEQMSDSQAAVQPVGAVYEGTVRFGLNEGMNVLPHIPSGLVELRVVRLENGGCKHILRAMTNEERVMVNGVPLQQEDEVVLLRGDEIEADGIILTFDKPGRTNPLVMPVDKTPKPSLQRKPKGLPFLLWTLGIVAGMSLIWFVFSTHPSEEQIYKAEDTVIVRKDSVSPHKSRDVKEAVKPPIAKDKKEKTVSDENTTSSDDFTLETQAVKGNVKAQYQLGMRWVTSNDCSEVIKGVKYLEVASQNGYADAQYALGIVYHKGSPKCGIDRNTQLSLQYMRQAAANGHQKARKFLSSASR